MNTIGEPGHFEQGKIHEFDTRHLSVIIPNFLYTFMYIFKTSNCFLGAF